MGGEGGKTHVSSRPVDAVPRFELRPPLGFQLVQIAFLHLSLSFPVFPLRSCPAVLFRLDLGGLLVRAAVFFFFLVVVREERVAFRQ